MKVDRSQIRNKTSDYLLVYHLESLQIIGRAADLSTTGFMLISAEPMPLHTVYPLKLIHPRRNLKREYIVLTAEVRWSKYKDHADWWESGLEIREIDPEDLELLRQVIEWLVSDETRRLSDQASPKDNSIPKIEYIKPR